MIPRADIEALDRFCLEREEELREPRVRFAHRQEPIANGQNNLTGSARSSAGIPMPHLLGEVGPVVNFPAPVQVEAQECTTAKRSAVAPGSNHPAAGNSLCVWCILERTFQGHGPAPRINGDVRLEPCARHSSGAEVRPPESVNPNAGCVAAFPKGRW